MAWDEEPSELGGLLESYSRPPTGLKRFQARGMGTENVLLLGGAAEPVLAQAAQEAFGVLERLEQALSKFLPGSDVSLVNALAAARPVRVGRDLIAILQLARRAWELSGGAFDPTVGPLLEAWGLVDLEGRIPEAAEIERLLEARGMDQLRIDEAAATVSFVRPGVALDLGGVGKGYAVDAVRACLRSRGIPVGAVIAGRSSVATWGSPPGEEGWTFELVHPLEPGETLCTLFAEPGSVSSSGAYERRFHRAGKEYGHLLDPRTGRPAGLVRSVTVWTENAVLGDVLSTALFVLGREALGEGGCAARLAAACAPGAAGPRASIILVEDDPQAWGGLRRETFHIGRPGLELR